MNLNRDAILHYLTTTETAEVAELFRIADETRRRHVGEEVHLRGLVEFSSICHRACLYCGLRAPNIAVDRYRLTHEQVLDCARQAVELGYGTVVLQSGEDHSLPAEWICDLVGQIRARFDLAVTLSVGERPAGDYGAFRAAGADRYLLRFETSNPALFQRIHPPAGLTRQPEPTPAPAESAAEIALPHPRLPILRLLKALDFETGSGVMIGIPGQSYRDLANDILLFRELDLDMIGVGPFIPHPATPLGADASAFALPLGEQVPATEAMTYRVIALARLVQPNANIPATTALATLNPARGRELGLQRGANIIMPNMTPVQRRPSYEIYPGKACINETAQQCHQCVKGRIRSLGRLVGQGRGDSPNRRPHAAAPR